MCILVKIYARNSYKTHAHKMYFPPQGNKPAGYVESMDVTVIDNVLPRRVLEGEVPLDADHLGDEHSQQSVHSSLR